MSDEASSQPSVSLAELSGLRSKTEAVSKLLHARLEGHLNTLRGLLAPRRLLGKHIGGSASRDDVAGSDKALEVLEKRYAKLAGKPFVLRATLDHEALKQIDSRIELHPWEYSHKASAAGESSVIDITSPVRWVLTFASDYTLSQVRQAIAGKEEKRNDDMLQFVVNTLVLRAVLDKLPAVTRLLADLRFDVSYEKAPGLGDLELVTLSSHLTSFRPPDELILSATGISGVSAFIELVDKDAAQSLRDPLREEIAEALG